VSRAETEMKFANNNNKRSERERERDKSPAPLPQIKLVAKKTDAEDAHSTLSLSAPN
jgi:hypothetical protein